MKTDDAVAALSALAHPARLEIVRFLVGRGTGGAAAGDIAQHLDAGASAVSFHLSTLANAGLVDSARQARNLIYSARYENLGALIGYLLNDCCAGDPRISGCC